MGTMTSEMPALPVALAELKAFLRIAVGEEDALLAGLVRAAAEQCEAFTGRALIDRAVEEIVAGGTARIRLTAGPVRAIEAVAAIDAAGEASMLDAESVATEIDAAGDGWLRLRAATTATRLRVDYRAGMAADWNGIPELLRHGIVRLAAHFYLRREKARDGGMPAAVTALWRPWRRLRLK